MMSFGIYFICILMYSGVSIGEYRKKSFKFADMNRAPLEASEIVLFSRILVSSIEVAGDPASSR